MMDLSHDSVESPKVGHFGERYQAHRHRSARLGAEGSEEELKKRRNKFGSALMDEGAADWTLQKAEVMAP